MKEIVIVTTHDRDELLYLSLEAIRKADDIEIRVYSDQGHHSIDLEGAAFKFDAALVVREKHPHYGNTFNLFGAFCDALMKGADIVHLIEDDTLIRSDYFEWARKKLSSGTYAAVCGRFGTPHISSWYESPCASWRADTLALAMSHVVREYPLATTREEMQRILDERMFPTSAYRKGGAEQDGFFLRVIEYHKWLTDFPPQAMATHLGWYGPNQPPGRPRPTGSFEQRIERCRQVLRDRAQREVWFGKRITDLEWEGMPP